MAKWFARLFHDEENSASAASRASDPLGRPAALTPDDIAQSEDYDDWAGSTPRRVLEPPVLMDTPEPAPGQVGGIRILARLAPEQSACVFMVDRPVLRGHSAWFRHITESDVSPLAQRLYEADGVTSVLLYEANVTVGRSPFEKSDWET